MTFEKWIFFLSIAAFFLAWLATVLFIKRKEQQAEKLRWEHEERIRRFFEDDPGVRNRTESLWIAGGSGR